MQPKYCAPHKFAEIDRRGRALCCLAAPHHSEGRRPFGYDTNGPLLPLVTNPGYCTRVLDCGHSRQVLSHSLSRLLDQKNLTAAAVTRQFKQFLYTPGAECFDLSATKFIQFFYVIYINLLGVQNVSEDFSHLILTQKMYGWIG